MTGEQVRQVREVREVREVGQVREVREVRPSTALRAKAGRSEVREVRSRAAAQPRSRAAREVRSRAAVPPRGREARWGRRMCRLDVVFLILALFMALPASAQVREVAPDQTTPQRRPPARPARPAAPSDVLRAYFLVEGTEMLAANTFDAVLGTTRVYGRGGGGEALGLWKGVFARVAFSVARETGDRVVISPDNEALPVGIPVTVDLQPIEIGIGWRSRLGRSGRLVGYAGASGLLLRYRERSQFGGDEDDTDTTYRGGAGFAGLEVLLGGWVIAGAEAQYRTVPDAIGAGGVSKAFGDTDLGGITVRILVGIRH